MEHVKLLRSMGFTEYEARAYLSLAKLGPSTVREIVFDSKLPRNKTYEALQRLEEKGKVISIPASPRKYRITDPEILKHDVQEMSQSVNELIHLIEQPKLVEFRDLFWVIKGKKAIEEKIAAQNTHTEKETIGCNTLSKILPRNLRIMREVVKRGVKVKMISTFKEERIPIYKEWLRTGAKIRVFDEKLFGPLLPRVSVFDGKYARLTIGRPEVKEEDDYITLWTESKAFAQMLRAHFMNMWKKSKPIEQYIRKAES